MHPKVIIGGGLAGLAAANALIDRGEQPILIEGGTIGRQKVCGEFISPEALPLLHRWDIGPLNMIHEAEYFSDKRSFKFRLPASAGSLSRAQLELLLVERARRKGTAVIDNSQVQSLKTLSGGSPQYELTLADGRTLMAETLFIATGRLPQLASMQATPATEKSFIGIKSHFAGVDGGQKLMMFLFPGAYVGVSPAGEGVVNVCCLAKRSAVKQKENARGYIEGLIDSQPVLAHLLQHGSLVFDPWLTCEIPSIGIKQVPNWPQAYFIGDAVATIHPASGDGLAMGVTSGVMAVDFASRNDSLGFRRAWEDRYYHRLRAATWLHRFCMLPEGAYHLGGHTCAFALLRSFPRLAALAFQATRETL
jgi:flavin-dependent dehydrogenase